MFNQMLNLKRVINFPQQRKNVHFFVHFHPVDWVMVRNHPPIPTPVVNPWTPAGTKWYLKLDDNCLIDLEQAGNDFDEWV